MISVVIPAYNAERYLGEAIDSVLAQTLHVDEILVVDDGSTDGTRAVAERRPNVRLLQQDHQGAGSARNLGAMRASGEFLAFLDADDLWLPWKIEHQLAVFASERAPDIVFGQIQQFLSPDVEEMLRGRIQCPEKPMPGYHVGSMLIHRSSFFTVGPFSTEWRVGEFLDWYLHAVDAGLQSVMLPEVVTKRRVHGENTMIRERDAQADYLRILKATLDRRREITKQAGKA